MKPNAMVSVAKITQSGNKDLDMKEKNLYYLVIQSEKGKATLNVGEKTFTKIQNLTK